MADEKDRKPLRIKELQRIDQGGTKGEMETSRAGKKEVLKLSIA